MRIPMEWNKEEQRYTTNLQGTLPVSWNEVAALWFEISIDGVMGENGDPDGNVGQTLEQAHAAEILGRILFALEERVEFVLSEMECGVAGEAIASLSGQAGLLIGIAEEDVFLLKEVLEELQEQLREEYEGSNENLTILLKEAGPAALPALNPVDQQKTVFYLIQLPLGVQKLSGSKKGQADLFSQVTQILLLPDGLRISIRVDSRTESAGDFLADKITYLTEFLGGEI